MDYVKAFIIGGIICVIGQILIDKTKLMSGRILVLFVVLGAVLHGMGLYEPLVKFGGAGATVPLPGFGYSLAKGAIEEVDKIGLKGAFTGGLKATSAGITAAVLFAFIAALIFNSKAKE
ncbi:MAG: stage V sporulation protein AE [Epulopiscium sp.]|nr:stage V sporulation protein AE [Candidatus Epulonipiscium sp.]